MNEYIVSITLTDLTVEDYFIEANSFSEAVKEFEHRNDVVKVSAEGFDPEA
jgi:hypothetical protein